MANYNILKSAIQGTIRKNGRNEITGNVLQSVLLAMVNSLSGGYIFAGIASLQTEPGTPDQKVFYLAGPGTYDEFGDLEVPAGSIGIIKYDSSWSVELLDYKDMRHTTATASGGTYAFELDAEYKKRYLTLNISANLAVTFDPTTSCAEQYILLRNSSNAEVTVGFNRSGSTGEMIGDTAVKVAAGGAVEVSLIATNGNVCVVTSHDIAITQ